MKVREIVEETNVEREIKFQRRYRRARQERVKREPRKYRAIKTKVGDRVKREEIVMCVKYCLEVEKNGN